MKWLMLVLAIAGIITTIIIGLLSWHPWEGPAPTVAPEPEGVVEQEEVVEEKAPVTSTASLTEYGLSIAANPGEGGSVTPGSGTYERGIEITVVALPSSGYQFENWSGDISGTSSSVKITMNSNKTVVANFSKIGYRLTTSVSPSGGGSVSPSNGTYESGSVVTLRATASSGYEFEHWSGDVSGTSPSIEITMNSDKSVVANFSKIGYSLTTSVSPSGSGSISPSNGTYESGSVVTLMALPSSGYEFDSWSGSVSGTSSSIKITMNSDKSVVANFMEVSPPNVASLSIVDVGISSEGKPWPPQTFLQAKPGQRINMWHNIGGCGPGLNIIIRFKTTIIDPNGSEIGNPLGDPFFHILEDCPGETGWVGVTFEIPGTVILGTYDIRFSIWSEDYTEEYDAVLKSGWLEVASGG